MSKTDPIDVSNPAGGRDPKLGDNDIRTLARAIIEIIDKDHYVGTPTNSQYDEDDAGEHTKLTLRVGSAPSNEANKGIVYAKDVNSKAELFYIDEDGDEIQLTSGGVNLANNVALKAQNNAGDGSIDLIKATTGDVTQLPDGAGIAAATQDADGALTIATAGWVKATPHTGGVVQVVNVQSGAVNSGTTQMPYDDTIPQNTEGDEYMTLAVTPKSATNKLKIEVVIFCAGSPSTATLLAALFQDSTAAALAAGGEYQYASGIEGPKCIKFTHYMAAGTTDATTFKVRGGLGEAGTFTFNGTSGSRKLGGVMASSITITEIKV